MTKPEIHPQAVVAAGAKLGPGIKIGAFAVVGEEAELGEGCIVHPHAVVGGPAKFGRKNVFYPCCAIGGDPQIRPITITNAGRRLTALSAKLSLTSHLYKTRCQQPFYSGFERAHGGKTKGNTG